MACNNGLCKRCDQVHDRKGGRKGDAVEASEREKARTAYFKKKTKGQAYVPHWRVLDG